MDALILGLKDGLKDAEIEGLKLALNEGESDADGL
jgi:hypothetical protein